MCVRACTCAYSSALHGTNPIVRPVALCCARARDGCCALCAVCVCMCVCVCVCALCTVRCVFVCCVLCVCVCVYMCVCVCAVCTQMCTDLMRASVCGGGGVLNLCMQRV